MGRFGKKNEIKIDPLAYNMVLLGEVKTGKEQPVSEPVLTEDGWKPMGEIEVGTKVYGEDGNLYNVTGVYPQGVKDVYEVTFRDGTKTRCGENHLWHVVTKKQRENNRKFNEDRHMILTLKDIMKDYKSERTLNQSGGKYRYKYSIPINKPIKYVDKKELKINPYLLGLLLGDGGFTNKSRITFTNAEEEILNQLKVHIKNLDLYVSERNCDNCVRLTICGSKEGNKLRSAIDYYGLTECDSREKFIPEDYLYASIEDRAAILSGLLNTDGGVQGTRIDFSTYSKQLALGCAELARSLGFIANIKQYDRTDETSTKKYTYEIEYLVSVIGEDYSLLNLSTKHKSKLKKKDIAYVKSITNIELIGKELSQCIMLDNPNHLYITNDFIVTHNTSTMKEVCERVGGEDSYIFLELAGEAGADAINDIIYEDVNSWRELMDIIEDIEDNKSTDYPNLKAIVMDTYDGWITLAEEEAIRLWNKDHVDKQADSIDASWNGFQKGQKKAFELMFDIIRRLRAINIATIIIGHVKNREQTDVATGATYTTLTSDVEKIYFNLLKKKMHFMALVYYDRTIITEKTGKKNLVTKKDITVNKIKEERRKIKWRDDNYAIDSGSRFADLPEETEFTADAIIETITNAIKSEAEKGSKTISQLEKEQKKATKEKEKKIAENEKKRREQKELDNTIDKIKIFIKANMKDVDKIKSVKEVWVKLGYEKFDEIDNLKDAKQVLKACVD